jgi:predicted RNase H-like nuclease
MTTIFGLDGCRRGWFFVEQNLETGKLCWGLFATIADVFAGISPPKIVGIDIPIGLPDVGARQCDVQARKLLGFPRSSSVFSAPIRPVLSARNYQEACDIRFRLEGKKMSKQAWFITPKIREVDDFLRENQLYRPRIREVHPEVSFSYLNGGGRFAGINAGKKTPEGHHIRQELLKTVFGEAIENALADKKQFGAQADDVLDAFVVLWSAKRILENECVIIPATREMDSVGFSMEIVG